jgi:hypothetical protein
LKKENFWPTRPQELLLAAALGDEQVAKAAWQQWLTIAKQTEFDLGSQRLAPLVYSNLVRYGVEHPYLSLFKGLYRRTWYHNHMLLRCATDVLERLSQNAVPTMLVKGVPLSLTVYRNMGARPMNDIDLAVPPDYAVQASRLLLEQGWVPDIPFDQIKPDRRVSVTFRAKDGLELDLHFSLFHESLNWADTAPIWRRARAITVGQVRTLTPCPEDQLLHTIVHGLRSNPLPPVRWIADAVRLIRNDPPINWNMVLDHADAVRLTLVVQRALTYVSAKFDCVPIEVLERTSRHKPSVPERLEFYLGRTRRVQLFLPVYYMRAEPHASGLSFIFGFFRFARARWHEDSLAATGRHVLKSAFGAIRNEFRFSRAQYADSTRKTRAHEKAVSK